MKKIIWSLILVMILFFGCLDMFEKTPEQEYYELKKKIFWFYQEDSEYYMEMVVSGTVNLEVEDENLDSVNEELQYGSKSEIWKKNKWMKYERKSSNSITGDVESMIFLITDKQYICIQESCVKSEIEVQYDEFLKGAFGEYTEDAFFLGKEYIGILDENELFSVSKGEKKEVTGRECQEFEIEINQEYLDGVLEEIEKSSSNKGLAKGQVDELTELSLVVGPIKDCVDLERGLSLQMTKELYTTEEYVPIDYSFNEAEITIEYIVKEYEESVSEDDFEIPSNYDVVMWG